MSRHIVTSTLFCLALLIFSTNVFAQNNAFLITYGSNAGTAEGDDDFTQVIFLAVPPEVTDSLYIRILDADCGGVRDALYGGVWDTKTRFRFYGGDGAFSPLSVQSAKPDRNDLNSGALLAELTIGEDSFKDDRWFTLAGFSVSSGDSIEGLRYFRLNVEGLNGNDGNIFDVSVSRMPRLSRE